MLLNVELGILFVGYNVNRIVEGVCVVMKVVGLGVIVMTVPFNVTVESRDTICVDPKVTVSTGETVDPGAVEKIGIETVGIVILGKTGKLMFG